MFRTALAAATLAAVAASASAAFAQQDTNLAGRITIRQDRAAGDVVAPRIALNPSAQAGPNDRTIVVQPRPENPGIQQLVADPGAGANPTPPPTQQIVVDPGRPSEPQQIVVNPGRPSEPQQIVVNPGRPSEPQVIVDAGRPSGPQQIVIDPPTDRPVFGERPVTTERPNDRPVIAEPNFGAQPSIDLVDDLIQGDAAPAQAAAPAQTEVQAAAPAQTEGTELLEPWQIQFRLVREGFRNINFVEKSDSYYFLTAEPANYAGLTYLMAVDLYGKVVSVRELQGYSAEARARYQPEAPRYQQPRYEAPRYTRYEAPRYSAPRYVADDNCDEYGRPRY